MMSCAWPRQQRRQGAAPTAAAARPRPAAAVPLPLALLLLLLLLLLLAPQLLCAAAALEPAPAAAAPSAGDGLAAAISSGGGWHGRRLLQALPVCNANFEELGFVYSTADHTTWASNGGKNLGDRVLFQDVMTRPCSDGVVHKLDCVVTTYALVSATVVDYELGAKAGGPDSFFQVGARAACLGGIGDQRAAPPAGPYLINTLPAECC
jgi:hypothetical protein